MSNIDQILHQVAKFGDSGGGSSNELFQIQGQLNLNRFDAPSAWAAIVVNVQSYGYQVYNGVNSIGLSGATGATDIDAGSAFLIVVFTMNVPCNHNLEDYAAAVGNITQNAGILTSVSCFPAEFYGARACAVTTAPKTTPIPKSPTPSQTLAQTPAQTPAQNPPTPNPNDNSFWNNFLNDDGSINNVGYAGLIAAGVVTVFMITQHK